MSGLKQLRSRIKSIKSTQKVTKAMQLVSASKFRKAKLDIDDSTLYKNTLYDIITEIKNYVESENIEIKNVKRYFDNNNSEKTTLLILFSSERGLCGSFNINIIKQLKKKINSLLQNNKPFKIFIIGQKGYEIISRVYKDYIDECFHITKDNQEFIIHKLQNKITNLIDTNVIDQCYLYFNKFHNALSYDSTEELLIPIINQNNNLEQSKKLNYEYEGENLIGSSIILYIKSCLNYAIVNSNTTEQSCRMKAMDSATKNASKIVNALTLKLNRTRQALITKELVEIISGAESV